jgi:hypothetical protein
MARLIRTSELRVIGFKQPMAQFVLNEYNRRVREDDFEML